MDMRYIIKGDLVSVVDIHRTTIGDLTIHWEGGLLYEFEKKSH